MAPCLLGQALLNLNPDGRLAAAESSRERDMGETNPRPSERLPCSQARKNSVTWEAGALSFPEPPAPHLRPSSTVSLSRAPHLPDFGDPGQAHSTQVTLLDYNSFLGSLQRLPVPFPQPWPHCTLGTRHLPETPVWAAALLGQGPQVPPPAAWWLHRHTGTGTGSRPQ